MQAVRTKRKKQRQKVYHQINEKQKLNNQLIFLYCLINFCLKFKKDTKCQIYMSLDSCIFIIEIIVFSISIKCKTKYLIKIIQIVEKSMFCISDFISFSSLLSYEQGHDYVRRLKLS